VSGVCVLPVPGSGRLGDMRGWLLRRRCGWRGRNQDGQRQVVLVHGRHSGPFPDCPQLSRDRQREQARAWRTANAICRADGALVRPDVHRNFTEPQSGPEDPKTETGNVYSELS